MRFETPTVAGKLVKRYKRFFADVELANGQTITAHCPNTGSMRSCGAPGDTVLLTTNDNPKRKLKFTWELTKVHGGYIGVNTGLTNKIVQEALSLGKISELSLYASIKQEVKYGEKSRMDFFLSGAKDLPDCFVEVKNVTLAEGEIAFFPDAVTSRGLKHIQELQRIKQEGLRAIMLYVVNRPSLKAFRPAAHIDPGYAQALKEAVAAGVEILAFQTRATPQGVWLDATLPWSLEDSGV